MTAAPTDPHEMGHAADDPDDFDPATFDADAWYAGTTPVLEPLFAAPVTGNGVMGDTLLDRPSAD